MKEPAVEISVEEVHTFEMVEAQLEGFFEEISILAKKKPDDAVNKFKLGFINQTLKAANGILGSSYKPFPDFEEFDIEGSIPSTSDTVTILSQYLRSMDLYRKKR